MLIKFFRPQKYSPRLHPLPSALYPLSSKTLIKRQIELLFEAGQRRIDFEEEVVLFL